VSRLKAAENFPLPNRLNIKTTIAALPQTASRRLGFQTGNDVPAMAIEVISLDD